MALQVQEPLSQWLPQPHKNKAGRFMTAKEFIEKMTGDEALCKKLKVCKTPGDPA